MSLRTPHAGLVPGIHEWPPSPRRRSAWRKRLVDRLVPCCACAAIALPFVVPNYYVQFASKALILGVLAMALNLVVGQGGLVSLCHAAFFGLAGYVLALMSPKYDAASLLLTLPARGAGRRRASR